jgi:mannose-6-phosphate isomerase-like protein (cupin superfamily)
MEQTSAIDLEMKQLGQEYDYLTPDGSEIRLLSAVRGGGLAHCRLPPAGVSQPVVQKIVEEIWYFISGTGQVWRKLGDFERVVDVRSEMSVTLDAAKVAMIRAAASTQPLCALLY